MRNVAITKIFISMFIGFPDFSQQKFCKNKQTFVVISNYTDVSNYDRF